MRAVHCCLVGLSLLSGIVDAEDRPATRSAEQVWADTCHFCHDNGIGPALLGRQLPVELNKIFVRNGLRQMPAFRVSEIDDGELDALAKWINQQPAPKSKQVKP